MYFKLAKGNLVRNKRMYVPYFLATAIMSGMFSIVLNMVFSKSVSNLSYGDTIVMMFTFGVVVMAIFTVGYMLYINSFLIKRRKKEFGLYGILGLEKRHVGRIIFWENLILNFTSVTVGLVGGSVFGRLIFMLLLWTLKTAPGSKYMISPLSILLTIAVFTGIFVLTSLYNMLQVRLANPIDLINGEKKGEKKVRMPLLRTILGILCIGAAYFAAIWVKSTAFAVLLFWPAVILVIIGTNLLFTAGSVYILNAIKKNKKFYYRPQNFISVSSLIHRMKQNAAGLANICILSTMVLVTVSGCCSLFFGQDNMVNKAHPDDIEISLYQDDQIEYSEQTLKKTAESLAEKYDISIDEFVTYTSGVESVEIYNEKVTLKDENGNLRFSAVSPEGYQYVYAVHILTAQQYKLLTGETVDLDEGEILLLCADDIGSHNVFQTYAGDYKVVSQITESPITEGKNMKYTNMLYIVAADETQAEAIRCGMNPAANTNPQPGGKETMTVILNISGQSDNICSEYVDSLTDEIGKLPTDADSLGYSYTNIFDARSSYLGTTGGLLFLGVFFTILFLTNTVLIIYFKQVSEGLDDSERFMILQKVGLSDGEVKRTINRQILIVFFLPLITALAHILAASNMLVQMLRAFALDNPAITWISVGITSVVFAMVYVLVYKITAKVYYRLVKW